MKNLQNQGEKFSQTERFAAGRRIGRKLTNHKKNLLENLLPKYNFSKEKLLNDNFKEVWCEIGFGYGERTIKNSKANPEILHIAVDFFLNGIANLLQNIQEKEINNIIIWPSDAESFLQNIGDNLLDKLLILFPNPWPKKKHHKRRIINQRFLNLISNKMKKNSDLIMATDHKEYGNYILNQVQINENFAWKSPKSRDYFNFGDDWVSTKYQRKSLSGNEKHLILNYINNKIVK